MRDILTFDYKKQKATHKSVKSVLLSRFSRLYTVQYTYKSDPPQFPIEGITDGLNKRFHSSKERLALKLNPQSQKELKQNGLKGFLSSIPL